ncbi:MAG: tetratricopeptide repeat protein, partial [Thermoanaerobaculum sp.]|nr:tetratricopeptide repeat protein [Thermoanaerobaculum sp.]MDW7968708.1 tetratricopeptide repeat protein [Thermoanaerobaculum sp.]
MTPKERIAELRREVELNPASRYFYQLGELLRREGELEEAAAILRQGLTHHPRYMAAWVSLGRALLDLQDANGARQALRQALDLDPQNPVAWRLLGEAYLALTQRSEALQAFEQALALVPGDEVLQEAVATLKAELTAPSAPGLPGPSPPSEVLPDPFAEIQSPPPPPAEELFAVEPLPSLEMDTVFALPPEPPPVAPALDFFPEGLAPPAAQ